MRNRKNVLVAGETSTTTDETVDQQAEPEIKLFGEILQDGETLTDAYKAKFTELSDTVRQAVTDGHVAVTIGVVRRKEAGMQYLKLQAKTAEGCAIISNGNVEPRFKDVDGEQVDETDGDNVVNHYNYGKDLKVRNLLTQRLATLIEGPDKALEAAAKNIAKAFNISIEVARERVKAMGGA